MKACLRMLPLFLCLFFGETLSAATIGTSAARGIQADSVPRTRVSWDQDTLFFGRIEERTILLDSFVVTNIGDKPYLIRDVRTSCDCTVIKYPKKPLLPGQSAALRIEFDSTRKAGPTQPGIIVYDNSSPNARSILYLDGEVTPRKQVKVIRQ